MMGTQGKPSTWPQETGHPKYGNLSTKITFSADMIINFDQKDFFTSPNQSIVVVNGEILDSWLFTRMS